MKKVFLLSNSDKSINLIKNLLGEYGLEDVWAEKTVKDALKAIAGESYDLILINSPLPDGTGEDFALRAVREGMAQVIFVSAEERQWEKLSGCGVFVMKKPFGGAAFKNRLKAAEVSFNRMKMLYDKNAELVKQMEGIKLINRAKAILIKTFGMSEDEAHRYIERQAMDLRKTKIYIAEKILSTYEM